MKIVSALLGLLVIVSCSASCASRGGNDALVFSGTVETREVRVGSKSGGRVTAVSVEEGQTVEAGRLLVKLDVAELEAQRQQAEARVAQQRARLERLEHGARPQEIAEARARSEAARANLDAVRNWPRPEEVEQARSAVAAAEAELNSARAAFERAGRLRATGDISAQEFDAARFRAENLRARYEAEKKRLDLLLNGSRAEDVRAAEARYRQAQEAERLVRAGARNEEIADARAQLAEAQARLEQVKVQLAEGEVRAPSKAVVEVLAVRPGDLLTPNQTVAKLLESDQGRPAGAGQSRQPRARLRGRGRTNQLAGRVHAAQRAEPRRAPASGLRREGACPKSRRRAQVGHGRRRDARVEIEAPQIKVGSNSTL
jgi:HlyD family secretion protein